MLGSVPPTKNKSSELDLIERIEQLAEGIAYAAPETRNERLAEIVAGVRREIRDWRKS